MKGRVEDYLDALEFDGPAQVRAWVEGQRNLTDREKRLAHAFADQWESSIAQAILERVNASVAEANESSTAVRARIGQARSRTAAIEHAAGHDRMDPAEGMNELGALSREIREANAILDAIEHAGERARMTANMGSDEYLDQMRRRFPAVPGLAKQRLSAAYLRGDEPSPFMSGRRS